MANNIRDLLDWAAKRKASLEARVAETRAAVERHRGTSDADAQAREPERRRIG